MFAVLYEWREHMPKEDVAKVIAQFTDMGEMPGTVAHYVRTDGQGGIIITNEEPPYSRSLAWSPFLKWDIIMIAPVADVLADVDAYINA